MDVKGRGRRTGEETEEDALLESGLEQPDASGSDEGRVRGDLNAWREGKQVGQRSVNAGQGDCANEEDAQMTTKQIEKIVKRWWIRRGGRIE